VLKKVTLIFCRITVDVFKKQFVLCIFECSFIVFFVDHEKRRHLVIFSSLSYLTLAVSFTSFQIWRRFRKKLKPRMWFLKFFNFTWNFSYFIKSWRDIMIIASMRFIHWPICLSDFKGIRFLYSHFLKNSNIIFLDISPRAFQGVAIRKLHISEEIIMEFPQNWDFVQKCPFKDVALKSLVLHLLENEMPLF